ncbi:YbaN family protein [Psychrobium sp. nBUS_13]|uniref:YbaN family protein n=1 Tax=Psychrobium sp. nBUS_13 TaxID=3395319 RepID=UPI003EBB4E74
MAFRSGAIKRVLLIIAGWIAVVLAVIGIVLPLLPTTPFLLLAAFCFSKSSNRFHDWLLNHPWFGDYIQNFQSGRGITMKAKISTVFLIWLSIGASVIFFVPIVWVKVLLLIIAIGVSSYVWTRPTYKSE